MKDRILKNWTLMRGFYVVVGIVLVVNSYMDKQWLGIAIGGYFTAMGLFSFGCASGNCAGGNCKVEPKTETSKITREETNS